MTVSLFSGPLAMGLAHAGWSVHAIARVASRGRSVRLRGCARAVSRGLGSVQSSSEMCVLSHLLARCYRLLLELATWSTPQFLALGRNARRLARHRSLQIVGDDSLSSSNSRATPLRPPRNRFHRCLDPAWPPPACSVPQSARSLSPTPTSRPRRNSTCWVAAFRLAMPCV